mmetsp:Transcript_30967/g.29579  ORF Transcript_30967/g.29579 Transcript_30967/m.29579 type:complete len:82 (+) Transcript_30967:72-317(+)
MGLTLYNIFKAGLLVTNGVAILHPQRFLAKYGYDKMDTSGAENNSAFKNQIVGLLQASGYLKVPLIAINLLVIIIEMVAGG